MKGTHMNDITVNFCWDYTTLSAYGYNLENLSIANLHPNLYRIIVFKGQRISTGTKQ